jgi:hypothetical protein
MIETIIATCSILGIIVFGIIWIIFTRKPFWKRCNDDCARCKYLGYKIKNNPFEQKLYCRKGYW